jgi:hypothetical protein
MLLILAFIAASQQRYGFAVTFASIHFVWDLVNEIRSARTLNKNFVEIERRLQDLERVNGDLAQ